MVLRKGSLTDRLKVAGAVAVDATSPHLIVKAGAGTGKTTTLIEGLKEMRGVKSDFVPSPQQLAIWDAIKLSKDAKSVCFVAFNKPIAVELQQRVPAGCDAMTMHSMGFKAVNRAFDRPRVEDSRVPTIISELTGVDIVQLRRTKPLVVTMTQRLVSLCKMNLIHHWDNASMRSLGLSFIEALDDLVARHDLDIGEARGEAFNLVPRVLERCKDVGKDGCVDFDDMIWLPIVLNLQVLKYDLLMVDEAQDLNRCQQALAKKAGRRLILVGDENQAIYGFAGADADSMRRMERELYNEFGVNIRCLEGSRKSIVEPGRTCVTLPLTVTRRCGKAIVREAQKLVRDFHAHDSNPEGIVSSSNYETKPCAKCRGAKREQNGSACPVCKATGSSSYHDMVADGDLILCRTNAVLVSQCLKFIRAGRKASIIGRDIGKGLVATVHKMKAGNVEELISAVGAWLRSEESKEKAKAHPSESRLVALRDRHDCLLAFTDNLSSTDGIEKVIQRIESVFTDDRTSKGIIMSSIHKAKGLESRRVFLLPLPKKRKTDSTTYVCEWKKNDEELRQELNLLYVAITRAIEELVYVS